jgi:molybdate transport system substrate-binding protein
VRRALALAALPLTLAGCGGGGKLRVDAASSLSEVFQRLEPKAQFDFAGSDELAFQLEQGAEADVYASASPKYPEKLHREKLVEKPRVFATNTLVLVVPRGNPAHVTGLGSLMRKNVKLVIGAKGVPVGDYTRKVLAGFCRSIFLGPGSKCPAARIVSEEQDVKGVVAKVALGEADVGFVYVTDVQAAGGKVVAISNLGGRFPVEPTVSYEIAVVRGAKHRSAAERFVALVTGPHGRAALVKAGFGLP